MSSKSSQRPRVKGMPLILMITLSLVLAGGVFWMSRVSIATANFPDIALAESTYPGVVGSRIDSCSLCHTSAPNLNTYGSAYKAKGRGSATSLTSIEGVDSDGDGFTNLQEITALTFPGDKLDFPVAASPTPTTPAYPPPGTPTSVSATATNPAYPPPATPTKAPPTATKAPPTATSVGPTATKAPPTATSVGPTATKAPPTATSVGPTATKRAATATKVATATKGATSTRSAATATKIVKATRTPGPRPTPVVQCVKNRGGDDEHDDRNGSSSSTTDDSQHRNPCPPGYHPRYDWSRYGGGGDDFFTQALQKISSWLNGNK
jgi:hypothetical protein